MESTLRLFKGIPIKQKFQLSNDWEYEKALRRTLPLGFIFSKEITDCGLSNDIIQMTDKIYGISANKLNNTFQSSWKKIQESSMEQLVIEQIMHYMTTYGSKDMLFKNNADDSFIYIPYKDLNVPQLDIEQFKFTVIKGYTIEELEQKVYKLVGSGIALKEDTMKDLVDLMLYLKFDDSKIRLIKNKEIRTQMYMYCNIVPANNIEFLRLLIYKCTGKTLIIKNRETIQAIKDSCLPALELTKLFNTYKLNNGFEKLAEIFYRFKPLWLAFRKDNQLKSIINVIRRKAVQNHEPMKEDYLNVITSRIQKTGLVGHSILTENLSGANIFRKIRLAYALNNNLNPYKDSSLFKIRNGKAYAKEAKPFSIFEREKAKEVLDIVMRQITLNISENVASKKIFIPNYITYALPSTEKQFTGNIPSGSSITIDKDMIFGVYWDNVDNTSIDLDLSMISPNGKIGWDRNYTDKEKAILFSGDMTDARNGATELFYVKQQREAYNLLVLNYYNYMKDLPVPFKILVAQEEPDDFKINYMINPNNILINVNSEINKKQKLLGLALIDNNKTKFVFCETYIGGNITSSYNDYMQHTRNYLFNFYKNSISLNEILVNAEAVVIDDKEKIKDCDIDLSPEKLEKDSILKLLVGDKQ